jgi:sialidase-1
VLAFCEGRKSSSKDSGDIDILLRRSTDGGKTWGPTSLVQEEGGSAEITIGNPAPVLDRTTGAVHLLFTRNNQRLFATRSADDGRTWSAPVEITGTLKTGDFPWSRVGAGPGHGIQLRNGRLLVSLWLNERTGFNYRSAAIYSDDGGKHWTAGGIVGPEAPDSNECMLFERSDGSVVLNMRSKLRERAASVSTDGGATWSTPKPTPGMPDPVCQASVLSIPSGRGKKNRVLFANAADPARRVNLTVRLSHDDGDSWPQARTLHEGPSAYSDLAVTRNGMILCLFESGQKSPYERLRLARFRTDWLDNR